MITLDEKEIQFYKHFKIKPIVMISDCSFHNLSKFDIEIGSDVCEYVEEESSKGCKDCEKSKENIEWYPPITDQILLQLILICGTEGFKCPFYYCQELVDKILNYSIIMSLNKKVFKDIQGILKSYIKSYRKYVKSK